MKKAVVYFLKRFTICLQFAIVLVFTPVSTILSPEDIGGKAEIVSIKEKGEKVPENAPQDNWNTELDEFEY